MMARFEAPGECDSSRADAYQLVEELPELQDLRCPHPGQILDQGTCVLAPKCPNGVIHARPATCCGGSEWSNGSAGVCLRSAEGECIVMTQAPGWVGCACGPVSRLPRTAEEISEYARYPEFPKCTSTCEAPDCPLPSEGVPITPTIMQDPEIPNHMAPIPPDSNRHEWLGIRSGGFLRGPSLLALVAWISFHACCWHQRHH
mmetsp:Transcript_15607/g.39610  ORF Transcript_15607/g.39610 Transcript_15607/m.39610 type:complete len:202 (-) Transcript_15607:214-819(-)